MPRGGKRPGAGRPLGSKDKITLEKQAAKEIIKELVFQHLGPMTEAQIAACKGLKYLVKRSKKGGKFEVVTEEQAKSGVLDSDDLIVEVWDKQPNTYAYTELLNRAIGKPLEEVDVNHGGEINVKWAGER